MTTYLDPNIDRALRNGLTNEGWPRPARALSSDRGGLTRGGITADDWGAWRHLGRPATADELNAITTDDALAFYVQRFVLTPRLDQVTDQRLRALLIDWGFTSGVRPIESMQRSLSARGLYAGAIDGEIGPGTIAALLSERDPRQLYRDVFNDRVRFYLAVAFDEQVDAFLTDHPTTQLHNCRGWINRALEFTP